MSRRRFFALLVFTIVVVAVAVAERMLGPDYAVTAGERDLAVPALAPEINNIAVFEVISTDGRLTFERTGGHWAIEERSGYPADAAKVEKALFQLSELRLDDPKTRRADRYDRIGVVDPSQGGEGSGKRLVAVESDGSAVADIIIGDEADVRAGLPEGGHYVRRTGEEQSWLAAGAMEAGPELKNWIERQILNIPQSDVERATLTHPSGETVTVSRGEDGKLVLEGIPEGFKLISDFRRDVIPGFLEELEIDDVARLDSLDADWGDVTRADYRTKDGLELTIRLAGSEDAGYWIRIDGNGGEQADAINDRTDGWAFAVPGWKAGDIKRGMADLIEPATGDAASGDSSGG